ENDLLGGPATEQDGDAIDQVLPRIVVLVIQGQLLGEAQCAASRDDRHLVDGIRARQEVGDQRVASLVVGNRPLLGVADDHRAPLDAHQDLVLGVLEVEHLDELLVWRAASSAASLTRLARSAPEKPGVPRARTLRSTSGASGILRACTRRISSRPLTSGRGTTTWRSKRPGRSSAGSRTSGRLVAAMRITPSLVSNPSISTR